MLKTNDEEYPFDIGVCRVSDGKVVELRKECFGQGCIFKSWRAFAEDPDTPCYVPEQADDINPGDESENIKDICWTKRNFLELCDGDKELAERIFKTVDWQSPSTELEAMLEMGEAGICQKCGKKFLDHENLTCPHCGAIFRSEYNVKITAGTKVCAKSEEEAIELAMLQNIGYDTWNVNTANATPIGVPD